MNSFAATQKRSTHLAHAIMDAPQNYRVLTGERPTGPLHLGHFFGSIVERLRLQKAGVDSFLILADYQVLTDRDSMASVPQSRH